MKKDLKHVLKKEYIKVNINNKKKMLKLKMVNLLKNMKDYRIKTNMNINLSNLNLKVIVIVAIIDKFEKYSFIHSLIFLIILFFYKKKKFKK